ncbi:cob(I)yrinic acid a,c-diamide adenosyltransferase [Paracoccus aerodenitrificans]|uniref:cob(I)yrinic acid a,c-diamide adenosyltransferase n=1 Tax=Paracoccus aerodenitrificans TaxID=3017781 RepID=UPI0022EFF6DE|nr:cob(I)yrinic acid a,c-diamide adenosyltransferase [Paracoccus aerodenitrificans]WBU63393.1 cob(I)yrinic acid a,c-diamide adenosyltransferase [Paracoccus aerodenitrificans]
MVVLNRIYTRSGDRGDTALSNGSRVSKHDPRVEAYGTVDELNAVLGICRLHAGPEKTGPISLIQNELFDLGADLSRPDMAADTDAPYPVLRLADEQVTRLETEIDAMNASLQPLRSFILPGGTPLSAYLHHARTVARRAERRATALASDQDVNPAALRYLNRLSDWLFVAARVANLDQGGDVLWKPGASRDDIA